MPYHPKSTTIAVQKIPLSIIALAAFISSCGNNKETKIFNPSKAAKTKPAVTLDITPEPDYNYIIRPLPGWTMLDTAINGLEVRLLLGPPSKERPYGNMVIASMKNEEIDTYTENNIKDLKNEEGITLLHKEHSDEIYFLKQPPFFYVENIAKARLLRHRMNDSLFYVIDIRIDDKGVKDIREGMTRLAHGEFAVVIANRLLYVIDGNNAESIKNREIEIILENYSENEAESMLAAILYKR